MSDKRTELETALEAARVLRKSVEAERDAAVREAKEAIHKQFSERMASANSATSRAHKELSKFIDESTTHELDKQRVFWVKTTWERWGNGRSYSFVEGYFEVVRLDTIMPGNMSRYSRPNLGETIVRKVKKNGEPSKAIHGYWSSGTWLLDTPENREVAMAAAKKKAEKAAGK